MNEASPATRLCLDVRESFCRGVERCYCIVASNVDLAQGVSQASKSHVHATFL